MAPSRSACPPPWRDKRGIAAVEMAAVAPVLLFILIACVDFGRAISQSIDLANAVRAGAQYAVTAATALLLARRFGTSAEFWMNLQTAHDLEVARAAMGEAAAQVKAGAAHALPSHVVPTA